MKKRFIPIVFLLIGLGCAKNAATGRKQLNLVSSQEMLINGDKQYREFLATNKVVNGTAESETVKNIGKKIAAAITAYYGSLGKGSILEGYKWEYNLVESKEVNAWCLPGGKIVVYTGLLPLTQNTDALATVIGHEVAHAVAEHGRERVSQQLATTAGSLLFADLFSKNQAQAENMFKLANGVSTLGVLLPFSRKQELEADKLGLLYGALAAYDPRASVPLWERMANLSAGQKPPEFASTHPSEASRIEQLKALIPDMMPIYENAKRH